MALLPPKMGAGAPYANRVERMRSILLIRATFLGLMASLGWFVINGVLQEFFAEGEAGVLASTSRSLATISLQQQAATAVPSLISEQVSAMSAAADPMGPPPGSASWVPGGVYAGLSADGQMVIIFDPAIGMNRFFRYTGEEIGMAAMPVPAPVAPLVPEGGGRPTNAVAFPPFVGGQAGQIVFEPIANRDQGGIRIGTLPRIVF